MRHDKLKLFIDIFLGIILFISVALAVYFYVDIKEINVTAAPLNLFLYWSYLLLGLAVLVALIIGPLMGLIQNPKSAVKGVVAVVALFVIIAIGYSFSSTAPVELNIEVKNMNFALRLADTSLYSMYILGALGILAIIVAELKELLH